MRPAPLHSLEERPLIVIWEVTRSCQLACRHCRAEAEARRHPLELEGASVERLLDQVAEIAPKFFVLTGGDPVDRPDLLWIIEQASARGLRVALSPSATPRLLSTDFSELRKAGIERMSLSLDGAEKGSHDAFRGVPGTWDGTMQAIDLARSAGIEVQINTTFSRANLQDWDAFAPLLQAIRPSLWSVFLLVPTGRAGVEDMLEPAETETLFEVLSDYASGCGFPVKTTEAPHYRRVLLQRRPRGGASPWTTAATNDGKGFVFISHTGEIQPSGFLPISCGNIRNMNLLQAYRDAALFRALRNPDMLQGKCGRCEFRVICGGSRARAFAVYGDCFAEDPSCIYETSRDHRAEL